MFDHLNVGATSVGAAWDQTGLLTARLSRSLEIRKSWSIFGRGKVEKALSKDLGFYTFDTRHCRIELVGRISNLHDSISLLRWKICWGRGTGGKDLLFSGRSHPLVATPSPPPLLLSLGDRSSTVTDGEGNQFHNHLFKLVDPTEEPPPVERNENTLGCGIESQSLAQRNHLEDHRWYQH